MSLLRNTLTQSSLTLGSRVLGFGRDALIAAKLGAGGYSDAFFAALLFPNLFRRFFAEGAFSQAFVPSYARTLEDEGAEAARLVAEEALRVLAVVTVALVVLAQLAMPWIMMLFQGAYLGEGGDRRFYELAVLLGMITMPYLAFMAMGSLFSGVLNSAGRFVFSAGAPILLNVFIIGAVLFADTAWAASVGASVAVSVAGLAQAALLWWGARRSGVRLSLLGWPKLTPAVRRVLALALPGAVAASGTQISILISQTLAGLEASARSWLTYADRLYQLPLGLVGVAVSVAILPRLSRAARADDRAKSQTMIDEGVGLSMALTLPAAAALLVAPVFLIDSLFGRGAFTYADAQAAGSALFWFALGVPAFVLNKVLAPAYFAHEDMQTPMRFALIGVGLNTVAGAGLFFALKANGMPGFNGLAVATSAGAWVNALLLIQGLAARGWWTPGPVLWSRSAGAGLASAGMGAGLWWLVHDGGLARIGLDPEEGRLAAVAAAIALGMAAYGVLAVLTGAVRVSDIRALRRPAASAPAPAQAADPGPDGAPPP